MQRQKKDRKKTVNYVAIIRNFDSLRGGERLRDSPLSHEIPFHFSGVLSRFVPFSLVILSLRFIFTI